MPKYEGNKDDDYSFERFRRKPKNPQKGKQNRSNEKQLFKDHYSIDPDDDRYYEEDWKERR